jgi:hypothetical protein
MSQIWIENTHQQLCAVYNHGEVLRKVDHYGWCALRPKEYGSTIQTTCKPQNSADLVQYVAAVNWMRSSIPNCSKRVAPLKAELAKLLEGNSRKTKKYAAVVSLLHLWGP